MSISDEIDNYFDARQKIFEHVGYQERWRDFPLDDAREYFWAITDHQVKFSLKREALTYWLAHDDYGEYGNEVYEDEISNNGVYRGIELTAIVADTNTDGNIFLKLFYNTNEIKLCKCGAMPRYVGDDGVERCRDCMLQHRVAQRRSGALL